jgi:hypothetical protein
MSRAADIRIAVGTDGVSAGKLGENCDRCDTPVGWHKGNLGKDCACVSGLP